MKYYLVKSCYASFRRLKSTVNRISSLSDFFADKLTRHFAIDVIIVLLSVLLLFSCSGKKDYKEFRLAYVMAQGGTSHASAEKFGELVEQRSSGKIKVKLYPNGMLGNDRILIEGLSLRSIDMVISGSAFIGWYTPEYSLFDVPFIFRDYDHMDQVLNGEIGQEIKAAMYDKREIHMLSFFYRGPRYLTTTRKIVRTPDDLRGLKVRVPELPVYIKSWKMFGANPTPLAYSDMFMALKQGVVDGQENPLEVIYSSHLYETQKYVMKTEHLLSCYFACVGDYFYEKFDNQEQKILKEAIAEASRYQNDLMIQYEEEYVRELVKSGIEFIDVNKEAFENLALQKLPVLFQDVWAPNIYQRIRNVK